MTGVAGVRRASEGAPATAAASRPDDLAAGTGVMRRAMLCFALGFVALFALYHETFAFLWNEWGKTGTFAHGYFIFPISAWLVWRLRAQLSAIAPQAQPLALVPLAACGALWLAAQSAGARAPEQFAFVGMVPCLVWGVFGNAITRRILYPLAFLFFAVPAGDFLMPTLMDHTADFTVVALRLSGIPVFREGNYFSIPSGNWSVVEACSGLRYLIASITLGVLFAYLNYRSAWRRAAFVVVAILTPIVANWLRAYMIVMIAHLSSNKLATGVDHLIYGWLFFGIVMLALFSLGNLWRDEGPDLGVDRTPFANPGRSATPFALAAITVAVIAVAAPWPVLARMIERVADAAQPGAIAIGPVDGWAVTAPATNFKPHYLKSRVESTTTFAADHPNVGTNVDAPVGMFIGYYSGQKDHGELISYFNEDVAVGDPVWGVVASRTVDATVDGHALAVVETEIKGATSADRLLAWRWYWINGRPMTNKYVAKAYTAFDKLLGRGDDSAVVVLYAPIGAGSVADARATLGRFASVAVPRIDASLAATHDGARR